MILKNPKGGSVVSVIVAVVFVAVFTIVAGPGAGYGVGCAIGLFCGGSGGGGGGGATTGQQNDFCTSAANACGMTNTGVLVDNGDGTGYCNATPPPNSSCPPPAIAQGSGFYATPTTVDTGEQATLHWNASNSTGCTISGDNGFTYSGTTSGSISAGAITQTTLFTLTCENGTGGSSTSASVRVIVDPQYEEI